MSTLLSVEIKLYLAEKTEERWGKLDSQYRSHRICKAPRKDGRKSARRQDPDTLRRHNVSPWRLDSVQTLFSQTGWGWGWGRRPGSATLPGRRLCQAHTPARSR